MRRSDLRQRCIVDVSSVCDFIRTITIDEATVRVAYDNLASHAIDEGGLYFAARFPSIDAAVKHLEEYLGRPFGDWTRFRRGDRPVDFATRSDRDSFWIALRENRVALPDPERFVLSNSEPLRDRLPFPSRYRDRRS